MMILMKYIEVIEKVVLDTNKIALTILLSYVSIISKRDNCVCDFLILLRC